MHTFVDPLIRSARVAAGREALVCDGARYTYDEFLERCRRLTTVLTQLGTAPTSIATPTMSCWTEIVRSTQKPS